MIDEHLSDDQYHGVLSLMLDLGITPEEVAASGQQALNEEICGTLTKAAVIDAIQLMCPQDGKIQK